MKIENLRARLNGKIQGFRIYEYVCALSLYVDELSQEEIRKANEQFKQFLTILPSETTRKTVIYCKSFSKKPLEQQAAFYELVRSENDYRKAHNQEEVKYDHEKIIFC